MPQGIGTYGSKVGRPPKKKMGGGMMKKKGMAKGGVVKKGAGGTVKKKMPKSLHPNLSNPNAGSDKNRDGIPLSKIGRAMTKSELERSRADKRRTERQKSGQLSQAKKKAKKTAVKAMDGGMMKKPVAMKDGGDLKNIPTNNSGMKKLPTEVRNNMGFKAYGGKMKKMRMGGKCRGMGAATKGGNYKMG